MSEFYLCHVALVGARMSVFKEYGYTTRNELSLCRVIPKVGATALDELPHDEARELLVKQFPIWIHNIITDPDFPVKNTLEMPLRRFEGELKDSKNNEVISAVLSAGFKNHTLDPIDLPDSMPLRQRCAMVVHIDAWKEAYFCLENDIVDIMMSRLSDIDNWIKCSGNLEQGIIEDYGYGQSA